MTGAYARLRDAVLAYDRALKAYGLLGDHWQESPKLDTLYGSMLAATSDGTAVQDAPSQAGLCTACLHDLDVHTFFPASDRITLGETAPQCWGPEDCQCEGYRP